MIKPIPDFPGYYADSRGFIVGKLGKTLKGRPKPGGYLSVSLFHNGKKHWRTVHRLVCLTFHGEPEGHREAAHLDGDVTNNSASNLQWKTPRENNQDKNLHGTMVRGSAHPDTQLTEQDVLEIRAKWVPRQYTYLMLAQEYNTSRQAVSRIMRRKTWQHV